MKYFVRTIKKASAEIKEFKNKKEAIKFIKELGEHSHPWVIESTNSWGGDYSKPEDVIKELSRVK